MCSVCVCVRIHTPIPTKKAHALVHARQYNGTESSLPLKLLREVAFIIARTEIM